MTTLVKLGYNFQQATHYKKRLFHLLTEMILLLIAAFLSALSIVIFLVPSNIAPGGVSGIAIILNHYINSPVGLVTLLLNLPILVLGYYMLGGWSVIVKTIIFVVLYSLFIDILVPALSIHSVSNDHLLNAIFSGIFTGISGGITFRLGATAGGTAVLIRILNVRYGIPTSSSTLYTDGLIVAVSGIAFGWESAMFAIISIGVYGMVCDYVLEGPSIIRTAIIVTNQPQAVSNQILNSLHRGVTGWDAKGMFTEETRKVLFVTVLRSQVTILHELISSVDPEAFVVISQGHVAYGKGFKLPTTHQTPTSPSLEAR